MIRREIKTSARREGDYLQLDVCVVNGDPVLTLGLHPDTPSGVWLSRDFEAISPSQAQGGSVFIWACRPVAAAVAARRPAEERYALISQNQSKIKLEDWRDIRTTVRLRLLVYLHFCRSALGCHLLPCLSVLAYQQ